jgi:hypothetical protein
MGHQSILKLLVSIQSIYIRTLCQKNEGSVETKQRPAKMGGRITYWTLPPKRTPFQTRIDRWPNLWKVPTRRRFSHTYPMWLWGHSLFKISAPGQVLCGTKWLLWCPHNWSPTFHSECRINKGLSYRGNTIDHWRSWCRGQILWPTPLCIHTLTPPWTQSHTITQWASSRWCPP